jgi:ferredoxin
VIGCHAAHGSYGAGVEIVSRSTAFSDRAGTIARLTTTSGSRRTVKIRVDEESCTGHGRCYALAPDAYAPDDHGHSVPLAGDVPAPLEEQARAGAAVCPERAITIEE